MCVDSNFKASCNGVAIKERIVGIDASNLRGGGGVTHLVELLRATDPSIHDFDHIVLWGCSSSLELVEDRPWLKKRNPPALDQGMLKRIFWQSFKLSKAARDEGCSVLFIPGGSFVADFQPVVVMSQNLLPFDWWEIWRYGWTLFTLKLLLLRLTQSHSFRKANGVIFLTNYSRSKILNIIGRISGRTSIVSHGLSRRFSRVPKRQKNISEYNFIQPYRIIYVSTIDQYKHQWHVVEAVSILRAQGFPVLLDLIGPAYSPALKRLRSKMDILDPQRDWVHYHGAIAFADLHRQYLKADLGLFASSCENMPNILMETMASGLPIACSNRASMPEVLGDSGVYFDPEQPESIVDALLTLIESESLRDQLSQLSYLRSKKYSWQRCANETFGFLGEFIKKNNGK